MSSLVFSDNAALLQKANFLGFSVIILELTPNCLDAYQDFS